MHIEIRGLYIGIFVCFFTFSDYSKSLTRISHSQALFLKFQPYLAGGPHGALAMDALHQRWKRCIEKTRKTMEENRCSNMEHKMIWKLWLCGSHRIILTHCDSFSWASVLCVWEATGGNVPEEPAVTPKLSKSAAWHVLSHSPVRSGCGFCLAWWHCWVSWFWRCSCIHCNSNWSTEEYLSIDSIVAKNVWRSMTTWRCFGGKL